MLSTIKPRRAAAFAFVLGALTLGACSDATDPEEEEEPEVAAIVVTATSAGGTSSATINNATGVQTGALTLRANQANTVTVRFLGATNSDESVIASAPGQYEVRIVQGTGTTNLFAATGTSHPYTGTITPTATGAAAYTVQLYAKEHGHVELSRTITATVQ